MITKHAGTIRKASVLIAIMLFCALPPGMLCSGFRLLTGYTSDEDAEICIVRFMVAQGGTLDNMIALYRMQTGQYPKGLRDLVEKPEDPSVSAKWHGPYIQDASKLKDAWGKDLKYQCPGNVNKNSYDLWSIGPDGMDGTGDDIGNWSDGARRVPGR